MPKYATDGTHHEPDLERFYGNLRDYVRMVTGGYSNLLMLDAKGGLGKTHNVLKVLQEERDDSEWVHQKGFTTPIEMYKTLWQARSEDTVLFLDDMSGVTNNTKALDMLKAATDTQGDENWVEYRTSRDIEHPSIAGETLPNTFCFRGSIIMSFNETPDNRHFNALKDRGTFYRLNFTYQERLDLIDEIANAWDFSELPVEEQRDTADWIREVTNPSFDVTIRTFEEICQMRDYAKSEGANWQKMALELFNLDYRKYRIIQLRNQDISVEEEIEIWTEEFDQSETTYYNLLSEVKEQKT
jgi:hypothetical protein